jgi:hypothetical protein
MKRFRIQKALTAAALLLLTAAPAAEADGKPPHDVPKVDSAVKVDGILNEAIWDDALLLEIGYEVRPSENVPAPVKTEFLMAYDDARLYCAYKAYDPHPSAIRARLCDRDHLWDDDWVALVLDTFNDQRRNFLLVCNPLGVQADNIETTSGEGAEWDPIWESAGRITDWGYVVELAVPFSSLRFQRSEEDQVWGIDAIRSYPRTVRHHLGLFPRDRNNNCYLCQADKIVGFAGVRPGKNIEIDPTFSTVHTQSRKALDEDFGDTESSYDPGLSAHWGFTPNLTLSATANPDFSQVEADAPQLDVNTQFALSYEEKRPFFLEAADYFHSRLSVVYTRTLRDPNWGVKVTGKEGPAAIGLFVVEDDVTNIIFPGSQGSNGTSLDTKSIASAARYRHDLGSSSTLGFFLTDREADDYHNRLAGIDGELRFTRTDLIRVQGLASQTAYPATVADEFGQPEGDFEGYAYDLNYLHATRGLDWYVVHRKIEPEFRADLGFMPQVGNRYSEAGWGYTWHNDGDNWWNMLNFGADYEYEDETDGDLLHKGVAYWFDYAGLSESWLDLWGFYGKRKYKGQEFDGGWVVFEAGFWPTGRFFCYLAGSAGDAIDYLNERDADHITLNPAMEYNCGRHLHFEISHTYEKLDVAGGRLYYANAGRVKAVYQFNLRSFFRAIVQFKDTRRDTSLYIEPEEPKEQEVETQFLFSYKVNPQTVLFLGYSDLHLGDDEFRLTQSNRTLFAKIGYAWIP